MSPFLALYAFLGYCTILEIKATPTCVNTRKCPVWRFSETDCRPKVPSAPVVQKVNSAIYWVSHYIMHKDIRFLNTHHLVGDFPGG